MASATDGFDASVTGAVDAAIAWLGAGSGRGGSLGIEPEGTAGSAGGAGLSARFSFAVVVGSRGTVAASFQGIASRNRYTVPPTTLIRIRTPRIAASRPNVMPPPGFSPRGEPTVLGLNSSDEAAMRFFALVFPFSSQEATAAMLSGRSAGSGASMA